jgi:hypothetical protein
MQLAVEPTETFALEEGESIHGTSQEEEFWKRYWVSSNNRRNPTNSKPRSHVCTVHTGERYI